MNSSEDIKDIAGALSKAQAQMVAAKKDSDNPFFKSKYADLASVVDAIRGPFAENGLSYVQLPMPTTGNVVMVETVLMHSSGQWISSTVDVPVSKADAQGYGSAITYARRYGLQAMAGLAADDDDGNAAAKSKPRATEAEMMPRSKLPDAMNVDSNKALAAMEAAPFVKPEGRTTFAYKNGQYSTAGMTKDQFVLSLELAKKVVIKYKDPNKAHTLLQNEFGVKTRNELTEDTGGKYLARLQELIDSE